MNNTKTTKRALLSSVMAMLICVAMLIGTTFAWFTDSASTAVNKIQAGTLKVQLLDSADNDLNGTTLTWQKAAGHESDAVLWEPGCTYNLKSFKIKNNGNLALKYKIIISGIVGDNELLNAIDFTVSGVTGAENATALNGFEGHLTANSETALITITGKMKKDAGNEYQGKSIDGIGITVVATQDTVEYDSDRNDYDADAEYDPVVVTATELAALMTPDASGVINLEKNYIVTTPWTPLNFTTVTINGNGHTISGLTAPLVKTATNITIDDLSISNSSIIGTNDTENGLGTAGFVSYLDTTTTATFKKCHLVNSSVTSVQLEDRRAAGIVSYSSGATLVIEDCSVENCEINAYSGAGGLVGYSMATTTITNSSVKKTSVTSTEDRYNNGDPKTPLAGGVIGSVGGTTTFTNVTATDVTVSNNNATAVYNDLIGRIVGAGTIN